MKPYPANKEAYSESKTSDLKIIVYMRSGWESNLKLEPH